MTIAAFVQLLLVLAVAGALIKFLIIPHLRKDGEL